MNVDDLVARLHSTSIPPLKTVGAASDLPAVMAAARGVPQSPAAYVLPIAESASPNTRATGAFVQQLTETFGVAFAVRELSDARGGQATVTLDAVRKPVRLQLAGWQLDEHHLPMEFVTGRLVDYLNGVTWWLDQYRVQSWLRKV